jgi:CBS domain-containing protein/sporulation protein YlmC with PRC-barrel domain
LRGGGSLAHVAGDLVYAFRVMRLPLLAPDGVAIGKLDDIVLIPSLGTEPPEVIGFSAAVQRRRVFVNANRLAELNSDGARLRSWDLDVNPFKPKAGEIMVGKDIIDTRIGDETVSDIALRQTEGRTTKWIVEKVRLGRRRPLVRRPSFRIVDWDEVPSLFTGNEMATEAARLRDMHPSDVAGAVRLLPLAQRRQLAEAMEDDRLADLLEELPEEEQLRIIEGLDVDRLLSVLEEMELDDLADLLAEMPGEQRTQLLSAMDVEDADVLRRLLSYAEGTAGSLMTPDVIIFGPLATVAQALAEVRDPEWLVSIAAQVFVTNAPFVAPTGTYLGVVHFQRLLREPPSMTLGRCLEEEPTVLPDMPEREVAERLASYNLLAVAVCDEQRRLLGAITVDDVLDRTLPADWRQPRREGIGS